MPPLQLPPDLPLGIWWYALWISIHGIFIYILRLLGDLHGHLQQKAEKDIERRLPALNEELWRLVDESDRGPYNGALRTADDLLNLISRFHKAARLMTKHARLRKHTELGYIACSISILVALICGGFYLAPQSAYARINFISIVAFSVSTIWSLVHLGNAIAYNLSIVRASDED